MVLNQAVLIVRVVLISSGLYSGTLMYHHLRTCRHSPYITVNIPRLNDLPHSIDYYFPAGFELIVDLKSVAQTTQRDNKRLNCQNIYTRERITESCFNHRIFDLEATRKLEIKHFISTFLAVNLTLKVENWSF